jgi:hypothetical protein
MTGPPPCLHCLIMDVISPRVATDSDNEIAFKVMEVLAEVIAAAPTRAMRRPFIADVARQLPGLVANKLEQRDRAGIPPSRLVSRQ